MKKVLVSLLAMMFVCGFALSAGAADDYNRTDPTNVSCTGCDKCPLGNIPCPGTTVIPGPQGSSTTVNEPAEPFDFDGNPHLDGGFGSYGYCSGFNYTDDPMRNCKFIFDVCTCDEACELKPGARVGIQMYIKTAGVYWAEDSDIYFEIRHDTTTPCSINADKEPTVKLMNEAVYHVDAEGERISGENLSEIVSSGYEVRRFREIKYYRTFWEGDNAKGKFETKLTNEGTPLAGAYTGVVPAANRVVALQSLEAGDYVITTQDAIGDCKLWIDIPAMRVDPSVAQPGAIIEVQIRLLFNREITGVCPECEPPDVCDCTLQVGVVCCDEEVVTPTDEGCLYFPYVVQGIQSENWVAGIALTSRLVPMPDNAYCKLTLTDQNGNTATYTKTGVNAIWVFMLDSIIPDFNVSLAPGAVSLKAESNYSMDGYSFLTDGTFGAGTLARGCGAGKCAP